MAAVDVEIVVVVVEIVVWIPPVKASAGSLAGGSSSAIVKVGAEKLARKSANVTPSGRFKSRSATGISEGFPDKLVTVVFV